MTPPVLSPPGTNPNFRIENIVEIDRLHELWMIDQQMYPDCKLTFEEFSSWWNHYDLGSKVLLQDDRIVSSIGIYPMDINQAWSFQQGLIAEGSLVPPSVAQCAEDPISNWYFSGIFVVPEMQGWNSPAKRMLRTGISVWLDSGHIAYPASLLALASSESGRDWLTFFGFEKIKDGAELPDRLDLYQLQARSPKQLQTLLREKLR